MFVLTPNGALINLDRARWIEIGEPLLARYADGLFTVNCDGGMLTEPGTREEAEAAFAQIVQLVEAKVLGPTKGQNA